MANQPQTIGWIPYWNLSPLKRELARSWNGAISFRSGHPVEVNRLLAEKKVSLAPASSVCLLKNQLHEIALPLGVASKGTVQSVYVGLSQEWTHFHELAATRLERVKEIVDQSQLQFGDRTRQAANFIWESLDDIAPLDIESTPKLKLSQQSASSVALGRIFYRIMFGKAAYDAEVSRRSTSNNSVGSMEIVIGDEALTRMPEFAKVIDLGTFWRQLTGLPFVFAVWQRTGPSLSPIWEQRIMDAAKTAEAIMHADPSSYIPNDQPLNVAGEPIDLASYWRGLHYRLSSRDIQGLLLFLCLARPLVRVDIDDAMVVKMMRWQELGASAYC